MPPEAARHAGGRNRRIAARAIRVFSSKVRPRRASHLQPPPRTASHRPTQRLLAPRGPIARRSKDAAVDWQWLALVHSLDNQAAAKRASKKARQAMADVLLGATACRSGDAF